MASISSRMKWWFKIGINPQRRHYYKTDLELWYEAMERGVGEMMKEIGGAFIPALKKMTESLTALGESFVKAKGK